jgi:hypothetical protein
MNASSAGRSHWDDVYSSNAEDTHSWFQPNPATSLELIGRYASILDAPIIDIGAGASRLVDVLLARGYSDITLLDLSAVFSDQTVGTTGGRAVPS